jgi:DNA invertase Pin-like site-specific DNA recombinase
MQVLGYVRVSTSEQADSGAGLEVQRQAIVAECARRGWQLLEIVEDAGYSAKSLKRPGVQSALAQLKGGEAEALVTAKLDRLSRSMADFAGLMADSQKQGWAVVCLDLGVDTSTPAGEAMANVLATFAQFERRLIGQRTKDAMAVKRSEGVRVGRPRETPAALVERVRQEREDGATLQAIADRLNADAVPTVRGGERWWTSAVSALLRSVEYDAEIGTA